jgi:hypothetical protein
LRKNSNTESQSVEWGKMASKSGKTRRDELVTVKRVLDKGENLLSREEHQLHPNLLPDLRTNNNFRIHQINTTATKEGRGYLALTIGVIRRLLESLGTEARQPGECPRPHIRPPTT